MTWIARGQELTTKKSLQHILDSTLKFAEIAMKNMKQTFIPWKEVLKSARTVDDHYSMWEEQQELLYSLALDVPREGIIVELGVAYGKTSVVLATAANQVGARLDVVDDFSLVGTPREYREMMKQKNLPVKVFVSKTEDVDWSEPIDMLLIDAGHDKDNIKRDTKKWIPFVKPGGLVAFHDYEEKQGTPESNPHWYVTKYADDHTGSWEKVGQVKQLLIKRRPIV